MLNWVSRNPHAAFGLAAATLVCAAVSAVGGRVERRGAAWIWCAWVTTPLLQGLSGRFDPAALFLLVDLGELAGLAALTWRSGRAWPVVAMAVQGLAAAIDLVRLVQPSLPAWTYITALTVCAYALLACLIAGAWNHRRCGRTGHLRGAGYDGTGRDRVGRTVAL